MADESPETEALLVRAWTGDAAAWGTLLARHQERLRCVAAFRLDSRLRGRIDAIDVVQEAFAAATARRAEFFGQSVQPLFLWLRWMVGNTLLELHRHHLGARMRDARREMHAGRRTDGSAAYGEDNARVVLVSELTDGATGPMSASGRAEGQEQLLTALVTMCDA